MHHTTDYRLSFPTVDRSPLDEGGAWAMDGLLAVSAFLGFAIVPGGGLPATLMTLAACGWFLWVLLWVAGSLIKRLIVATAAGIGRRRADEPGRVAVSGRRSSPFFHQDELARSEV